MAIDNDDKTETVVAFVSGAIIGVAVTLLLVRMQKNRMTASSVFDDEDYYYDGGDLFV